VQPGLDELGPLPGYEIRRLLGEVDRLVAHPLQGAGCHHHLGGPLQHLGLGGDGHDLLEHVGVEPVYRLVHRGQKPGLVQILP
jgi:hypothetical protein